MKNLKAGDIIVDTDGEEAKVLEVLTNTFLRSCWCDFEEVGSWYAFAEAEKAGWKIKGEDTIIFVNGERYKLIKE